VPSSKHFVGQKFSEKKVEIVAENGYSLSSLKNKYIKFLEVVRL
jgi:hypothetical protein